MPLRFIAVVLTLAANPSWMSSADAEPVPVTHAQTVDITIDGKVDEAVWASVPAHGNMLVSQPDTLTTPAYATRTRFLYTNDGLYVAGVMEQPAHTLVSRLSGRDQFLNRDSFAITIDPSGAGLYGYWFEVNLGGSVMDGKVVPERSISEQWDGPWQSATAKTDTGWSVEMFLPWSMMAMPPGRSERRMGIWVSRKVAHLDETHSWPALPQTGARFMSALQPVEVPGIEPKQQAAVFPYASSGRDEINGESRSRAGLDFAYSPSPNLQVTGTLNPDFGAVESDDVVVNLTAFETYFPEKRLFFLEGNEVFVTTPRSDINRFSGPRGQGARATPSTFTPEPTTMLNTRRIGGAPRHVDIPEDVEVAGVERSKPTDLLGAIKLVGQAGGLRYGMLGAFEDEVRIRGTRETTGEATEVTADGRNFAAVRTIYEQTGGGRRALGYMGTMVSLPGDDAFVHGVDGHYQSKNGRFTWDGQYLRSDADGDVGHGIFNDFRYVPRQGLFVSGALDYLDDRLDISDLGFIRRNDVIVARSGIVRLTSRNLKFFRRVRNSLFFGFQSNTEGFANRVGIFSSHNYMLKNRSEIRAYINHFPARWDDRNSRGNGMYKVDKRWFLQLAYGTDSARPFSISGAATTMGEEFGKWTTGFDIGITFKPIDRFSADLDLRYQRLDGWLVYQEDRNFTTYAAHDVRPVLKTEFFISARHQFRLTVQWAAVKATDQRYLEVPDNPGPLEARPETPADGAEDFAISRLTAQFRYRWEIGPLSDFFAVYTRGGNIDEDSVDSSFDDLLSRAVDEPIVDAFVLKLRYRFGN